MRYKLIGIDLDDTLLDGAKQISDANLAAIERAQEAGVLIVPCTGRTWHKAKEIALAYLPNMTFGIFHDGAMVCDVVSGKMHWHITMPDDVTASLMREFDRDNITSVFCRVSDQLGYDYLLCGNHLADEITQTWLARIPQRVTINHQAGDDDVRQTLGMRIVVDDQSMFEDIEQAIANLAGADQLFWHRLWFANTGLYVLQIYHRDVNKWPALQRIARQHDIRDDEIAFIGDQINDVTALREAACGIAMANAIAHAKEAANHITHDCGISGVAHAIDQLFAGRWG
jgi:hypothetical protein